MPHSPIKRLNLMATAAIVVGICAFTQSVDAQTIRAEWTTSAQFGDRVRDTNVNWEIVPDQLQLNLSGIHTPWIWVSNSDTGTSGNTIAQLSTSTRPLDDVVVGEVVRVIRQGAESPSRTAVDVDFNCWVGYRGHQGGPNLPGVGRLMAESDEWDDDLYLDNVHYSSVGIGNVWDRARAVAINADGNVWVGDSDDYRMFLLRPDDGAILNTHQEGLPPFVRISEPDNSAEAYRPIAGGGYSYGFSIDAFGNLWASQRECCLGRYDAHTGEHRMTYTFGNDRDGEAVSADFYGIAVDLDGNVWLGNGSHNDLIFFGQEQIELIGDCPEAEPNCSRQALAEHVDRISPGAMDVYDVTGDGDGRCDHARGVAVDQSGNIWVNCNGQRWNPDPRNNGGTRNDNAVMHVDGVTHQVLGMYRVGDGPLGITATADGYIWTVNQGGGDYPDLNRVDDYACPNVQEPTDPPGSPTGTAANPLSTGLGSVTQLRGSDGSVVATYPTCGPGPYTYSDMAGYTLQSVTLRSGWWRSIRDSGEDDLVWERVSWNIVLPADTKLRISIGASNAPGDIETETLSFVHEVGSAEQSHDMLLPAGITGRYVAIEAFFFTRNDYIGPIIEDIIISSECGATGDEVCNGFDDDCDGTVDRVPGTGERITGDDCDTGLPGVCNDGVQVCIAPEQWACQRVGVPSEEVCDGVDNDCDGLLNEGVTNACNTCGDVPEEICELPALDNDCDGLFNEGVVNTCIDYSTANAENPELRCVTMESCGACDPPPGDICDDGIDNDCDGIVDEDGTVLCIGHVEGVGCTGIEYCGDCPALFETCDLIDNDCNGLIDDGVQNICFNFANCATFTSCDPCGDTPAETCNGRDDDCDGQIDEGTRNACGTCGDPPEEVCDGIDNDCDGDVDEDVSNICGFCGEIPRETCDGIDNDCDGYVDEEVSNRCGTCGPEPLETCNGFDDDCDGTIDEGVTNVCGNCGAVPLEVCDGLDNDCNGFIDEDTDELCDQEVPGTTCYSNPEEGYGQCAFACFAGECGVDEICVDDYCLDNPCVGVQCDEGYVCREGICQNLCDVLSIVCEGDLVCVGGSCVEDVCINTGCEEGFTCVENECVADACADLAEPCSEDEVCFEGDCIPDPCLTMECDGDLVCVNGDCVDPCDGVECDASQDCVGGFCVVDACYGVLCPLDTICIDGNCTESECMGVTCPEGQICRGGECYVTRAGGVCGEGLSRCGDGLVCYENICRDVDDPALAGVELDAGTSTSRVGMQTRGTGCDCSTANRRSPHWGWVVVMMLGFVGILRRSR